MTKVKVRPGEPVDKALRQLKKKLDREGVLKQVKKKRYYDKPSEAERLKSKQAKKYQKRR